MRKKTVLFLFCLLCAGMTGCGSRRADFIKEAEAVEMETVTAEASPSPEPEPEPEELPQEIYVDVCGAVENPGVFCLPQGSRVFQAVEAAGGFLPEAAGESVNRAQGLSDGEQIYVPTREELEEKPELSEAGKETEDPQSEKVNLNTADEETLCTLSGIGASKARAIISYREEHGPFVSVEGLMDVEGIKEGTFAKIKDEIEVR